MGSHSALHAAASASASAAAAAVGSGLSSAGGGLPPSLPPPLSPSLSAAAAAFAPRPAAKRVSRTTKRAFAAPWLPPGADLDRPPRQPGRDGDGDGDGDSCGFNARIGGPFRSSAASRRRELLRLWATRKSNGGEGDEGAAEADGDATSEAKADRGGEGSEDEADRGTEGGKDDGEDGFDLSEIATADLFDDIDFDDDFLDLIDDESDLEEILSQMEDGDYVILSSDEEEEEDDGGGDEEEGEAGKVRGGRRGAFVVASADLEEDALLFDLEDMDEDEEEDDEDEMDDETLLEELLADDDVDPDDLVELERLLAQKRKIEDALELRRILGPRRAVDAAPSSSLASEDEDKDEGAAAGNATAPTKAAAEVEEPSSTTLTSGQKGNGDVGSGGGSAGAPSELERALLQGVVPADAGVGSGSLPGDFGFDPLNLSTKDYFKRVQLFLLGMLPEGAKEDDESSRGRMEYDGSAIPRGWRLEDQEVRPPALILRDYREAEIRHGRLAMLAALFWPLQEIADRLLIPSSFGRTTMIYGGPTLPFFSLLMVAIMLLLGYLDIYAAAVKDADAGEAFLPGECFWDPLKMLDGAPDDMKRNMQSRELNNGRMAMVAVAFYILEEAVSHRPLISLPFNEFLFEPAYQIPAVQAWLDHQFQSPSPTFTFPEVGTVDFVEAVKEAMEEEAAAQQGGSAGSAAADVAAGVAEGAISSGGRDLFPDNLLQ